MKSVPFLVQTLRSGMQKMHEQQKTAVSQINLFIKNRTVIVNNKKYENCQGKAQEYYFDHGKEYLRVDVGGGTMEVLEFEDCEFL